MPRQQGVWAQTPPAEITPPTYGDRPGEIVPPGAENICASGTPYAGGQTVEVRGLRLALPVGRDFTIIWGLSEPHGEFVRVCDVQDNAAIFLSTPTGREITRVLTTGTPSAAGATLLSPAGTNAVLDQVAAGARVVGTTAAPSPTPPSFTALLCPTEGAQGGRTVTTVGSASVYLPEGSRYVLFISPPGPTNPTFTVCATAVDSSVTLSALDCREVSRETRRPEAEAILDAIAASCAIAPAPTPPPLPAVRPIITPPDTGDGGLLDQPLTSH